MPMSKKHYDAMADMVNNILWDKAADPATITAVMVGLADICEADNPRFDKQRFLEACVNKKSSTK